MTIPGTAARPGPAAARLRQVISALAAAVPDLAVEEIPTLMAAARVDRGIPLREIATYLAAHADALNSGTADCPAALVRLTRVLRDAGQSTVATAGPARLPSASSGSAPGADRGSWWKRKERGEWPDTGDSPALDGERSTLCVKA
jgi:hypothetical protein